MNPLVDERQQGALSFVTLQLNALREDPEMSDAMYDVIKQSILGEFERFVRFVLDEGIAASYSLAFDEGYIKALTHLQQRRVGVPSQSGAHSTWEDFRLSALKTVGQQITGIPKSRWKHIENNARQLKHRLGREYHIVKDKGTGRMTVTLTRVEAGPLIDAPKRVTKKMRQEFGVA